MKMMAVIVVEIVAVGGGGIKVTVLAIFICIVLLMR